MRDLFVQEPYRSRGVGSLLFNGVLKRAKEMGCKRVEFDVDDRNTRAQKFYGRLGAVNVTTEHGYLFYRVYKEGIDRACNRDINWTLDIFKFKILLKITFSTETFIKIGWKKVTEVTWIRSTVSILIIMSNKKMIYDE